MDIDRRLVISGCRESLRLAHGDSRVALNELGEHTTHCLDTQAQRRHIQQEDVFDITGQHTCLEHSTHRTTSSGLTLLFGALPKRSTSSWTIGIRVEPPTSTTSSISFLVSS